MQDTRVCAFDDIPPNSSSSQCQTRIHSATNHTAKRVPKTATTEKISNYLFGYSILHSSRAVLNNRGCISLTMSYHQTSSKTRKFHSSTKTVTRENLDQDIDIYLVEPTIYAPM